VQPIIPTATTTTELTPTGYFLHWGLKTEEVWTVVSRRGFEPHIERVPPYVYAVVDPADPSAYAWLGLRHHVLPGQAVLCNEKLEHVWLNNKPATLKAYRRAAERLVRHIAAMFPRTTLAHDLAMLDSSRKRVRWVRTVIKAKGRPGAVPRRFSRANRHGRAVRRARRSAVRGTATARTGDPPEPPHESPRASRVEARDASTGATYRDFGTQRGAS
jgi:hypothetical protein